VLKDHLNVGPVRTHLRARKRCQIHNPILMVVKNLSGDFHAMAHRAQNIHNSSTPGALAAARPPDNPERLPAIQREGNAINGAYFANLSCEDASGYWKAHTQVLNFEQR